MEPERDYNGAENSPLFRQLADRPSGPARFALRSKAGGGGKARGKLTLFLQTLLKMIKFK